MRKLFFKVLDDTCNINEIRVLVDELPERAIRHMDGRAEVVIPKLFPGETADEGFCKWAKTAAGTKFIQAVQVLSHQGAISVTRSRGGGKRSGKRLEPVIMGIARRAGGNKDKGGGRPKDEPLGALITHLAMDWLLLTGSRPITGRSDGTAFGDLVHTILGWQGIDPERAAYGLRLYQGSSKSVAGDTGSIITDERPRALDAAT
jgi:hypothetical protein